MLKRLEVDPSLLEVWSGKWQCTSWHLNLVIPWRKSMWLGHESGPRRACVVIFNFKKVKLVFIILGAVPFHLERNFWQALGLAHATEHTDFLACLCFWEPSTCTTLKIWRGKKVLWLKSVVVGWLSKHESYRSSPGFGVMLSFTNYCNCDVYFWC